MVDKIDDDVQSLKKQRVLVVEDDARLRELVCRGLREAGHTPMPASDGVSGVELATTLDFDSIILDIGLPDLNGLSVANSIRVNSRVPILMLTARDSQEDILRGFHYGADDYLTKPFSFRELLARVAVLGRASIRQQRPTTLLLDGNHLTVHTREGAIPLSRNEFLLLSVLQQNFGANVSRQTLMTSIWGEGQAVSANALDVLVNSVRIKLPPSLSRLVLTVRGVGYRLLPDSDEDAMREKAHCS